jgi:hypothetical protein
MLSSQQKVKGDLLSHLSHLSYFSQETGVISHIESFSSVHRNSKTMPFDLLPKWRYYGQFVSHFLLYFCYV